MKKVNVIRKAAGVVSGGTPTALQLEQINRQAKTALTAEEVYVFSMRLCDDQPDRDWERFDTAALPELARMLVGRTGLSDHQWSAGAQVARIFAAGVEVENGVHYIRAWAYVLRAHHQQLIDEIEGGIRREVSIGCAMGHRRCSICGAEMGSCQHQQGQSYDGVRCVAVLSEPRDAYEFSFVAVPAQPMAGVMKQFGGMENLEALRKAAAVGMAQLQRQRGELVRLGLALEMGLDKPLLERMAAGMQPEDLDLVCRAWSRSLRALYPAQTQLQPIAGQLSMLDDEFRI